MRRGGIALALVIAGMTLPGAVRAEFPAHERKSGFETMGPAAQAMQRDDFANPGMLAAGQGEVLWSVKPGGENAGSGKSCADCHGAAGSNGIAPMKGVAARYPAFDTASGKPIDLAGRILQCRVERQGVPAARESPHILALEAVVALQSRGMPIAQPDDPRLAPALAEGRALFSRRIGQLDLSCKQCHDEMWGRSLGGSTIPQGHPTGYPLFRQEWQGVGSLQRRLRNCMTGVRAEPYAPGAPELIALELFLKARAAGMALDAPAVRP
jgi:sulfur-oxidizing protein SoxA